MGRGYVYEAVPSEAVQVKMSCKGFFLFIRNSICNSSYVYCGCL
jgi:hypothetical protein